MLPPTPAPAPAQISAADSIVISGSRSASRLAALCADVPVYAPVQSKKAAPASLKRVEALLLEGEKLPFQITKVKHRKLNRCRDSRWTDKYYTDSERKSKEFELQDDSSRVMGPPHRILAYQYASDNISLALHL